MGREKGPPPFVGALEAISILLENEITVILSFGGSIIQLLIARFHETRFHHAHPWQAQHGAPAQPTPRHAQHLAKRDDSRATIHLSLTISLCSSIHQGGEAP